MKWNLFPSDGQGQLKKMLQLEWNQTIKFQLPVNILFVRAQYLSKSIVSANSSPTNDYCLSTPQKVIFIKFHFSITNLCVVYADMCVMLYSDVIIHRIYGIRL